MSGNPFTGLDEQGLDIRNNDMSHIMYKIGKFPVADPGGGPRGPWPPPPVFQIRTISYAPLCTF